MSKQSVKLDSKKFWSRLQKVHAQWQQNKAAVWNSADALNIVSGKTDEDNAGGYSKVTSMHLYLLNFEFPEANIVLCEKEVN